MPASEGRLVVSNDVVGKGSQQADLNTNQPRPLDQDAIHINHNPNLINPENPLPPSLLINDRNTYNTQHQAAGAGA